MEINVYDTYLYNIYIFFFFLFCVVKQAELCVLERTLAFRLAGKNV